jgi:HAD superfamily hydrolase (TIGR01549 family)
VIESVFFDVGETLVDETRLWAAWADWLHVPRLTFFGVLGGVIERGEHHTRTFEIIRPGIDLARERAARRAAGGFEGFDADDLYPDALPCLQALRAAGYRLGLAGNQPERTEGILQAMGLPVDVIASSAGWGVEKPDPAFFARVAEAAGTAPERIAYVGDRLDNDVLPARAAGMVAVFLRRGPWGYLHALRPEVAQADRQIDSLNDLPARLRTYADNQSPG